MKFQWLSCDESYYLCDAFDVFQFGFVNFQGIQTIYLECKQKNYDIMMPLSHVTFGVCSVSSFESVIENISCETFLETKIFYWDAIVLDVKINAKFHPSVSLNIKKLHSNCRLVKSVRHNKQHKYYTTFCAGYLLEYVIHNLDSVSDPKKNKFPNHSTCAKTRSWQDLQRSL